MLSKISKCIIDKNGKEAIIKVTLKINLIVDGK